MHADDIVSKRMDGRDSSFVRVRELVFWKMIDFYFLPNSMSNLLIKTSTFETIPKISSCKRSSGNFGTSSSSPFPKAKSLKRRNPKLFVSQLFGKFMPSYPMPMRYRRFCFTQRRGASTPLTSNPSSVSSVILKTGEDGGWSTAAVHWHMQYSLRRISPVICPSEWALRERTHSESCTVFFPASVCRALFGTASPRMSSARAPAFQTTPPSSHSHSPFYSPMSILSHFQNIWVIRYLQHLVTHLRMGTWARVVVIGAAAEVVGQAQRLLVGRAGRYVSFYFRFCSADGPQGEHGVRVFPARASSRHLQHSPPLRRTRACRLDLGGGPPPQPSNLLAGKSGKILLTFFFVWKLH